MSTSIATAATADEKRQSVFQGTPTTTEKDGVRAAGIGDEKPDVWSTLGSFSPWQEFGRLRKGKISCMRDSLMLGIGTGAAVVAVSVVARRSIRSSANWGVAAFVGVSIASHMSCQRARAAEVHRVKVIMEEFNRKRTPSS